MMFLGKIRWVEWIIYWVEVSFLNEYSWHGRLSLDRMVRTHSNNKILMGHQKDFGHGHSTLKSVKYSRKKKRDNAQEKEYQEGLWECNSSIWFNYVGGIYIVSRSMTIPGFSSSDHVAGTWVFMKKKFPHLIFLYQGYL